MPDDIGAEYPSPRQLPLDEIVNYAMPEVAQRWASRAGRLDTCARLCGRINQVDSEAVAVNESRSDCRPALPFHPNVP